MPNPNEVPGKYDEPELTTYANRRDYSAFKEAYLSDPYNAGIMAALDSPTAPAIIEDVAYVGQDAVRADAEGLRAALRSAGAEGRGFISSISPGMLSSMGNAHYESRHDAGMALAAELNKEYRAIVDAGHTLQIDASDLADSWDQMNPEPTVEEYLKYVRHSVDEINEAIRGIDRDKVRITSAGARGTVLIRQMSPSMTSSTRSSKRMRERSPSRRPTLVTRGSGRSGRIAPCLRASSSSPESSPTTPTSLSIRRPSLSQSSASPNSLGRRTSSPRPTVASAADSTPRSPGQSSRRSA